MTYQAPLADMSFALKYGAALLPAIEEGFFGDLSLADVDAVLSEASRVAAEIIAAQPHRRRVRHDLQGRRCYHGAGLERGLRRLA